MIELAERHGTPTGPDIRYLVDDAETLSQLEDSTFDGAVCQLGLMDIPDLDSALTAIYRVLTLRRDRYPPITRDPRGYGARSC